MPAVLLRNEGLEEAGLGHRAGCVVVVLLQLVVLGRVGAHVLLGNLTCDACQFVGLLTESDVVRHIGSLAFSVPVSAGADDFRREYTTRARIRRVARPSVVDSDRPTRRSRGRTAARSLLRLHSQFDRCVPHPDLGLKIVLTLDSLHQSVRGEAHL